MKSGLGGDLIENDESGSSGYILYDIRSSSMISSLTVKSWKSSCSSFIFSSLPITFHRILVSRMCLRIKDGDSVWMVWYIVPHDASAHHAFS